MRISTVGLDADDTLWHNESIFRLTQDRFRGLMRDIAAPEALEAKLAEVERRNLSLYGYGVKGFTLSMIETAMELTGNEAPSRIVADILAAGREMLAHPVEPLPGVHEALADLCEDYRLVLITKGDLLHQRSKLERSGLGRHFRHVEVVSHKTPDVYRGILSRLGIEPSRFLMVGNSPRSDILPVLGLGGSAAYVPAPLSWSYEQDEVPSGDSSNCVVLRSLFELPDAIRAWS